MSAPYSLAHATAALLDGWVAAARTASAPSTATPAATALEWTDGPEAGFTNAPGSDEEFLGRLTDENAAPTALQAFGDARTTPWLIDADPDQLQREGTRSQARMSLLTRMMFKAGGNCAQVDRVARQIPLCMKDDRDGLLESEILKALALFRAWWLPEKARRDAQLAEARAIGEAIDDTVLPTVLKLDQGLERLVYVAATGEVFDRGTGRTRTYDNAAGEFAACRHRHQDAEGKQHNVAMLSAWRAHPARKTVDVQTWAPGRSEFCEPPEAVGGNTRAINSWRGLKPLAEPSNHREWAAPFENHVAYLVPDEAQRRTFMQWLAHIVQDPGTLPHTCYLMIALETGIGRNWLAAALARVLRGYVAAGVSLTPILDGKFNGRLSQKLLATVDETREGMSEHRHARGEALKRLVTEENRLIDTKYGRQVVEFNACRWLMLSNHRDALPFDNNDRRVVVIENPTHRQPPEYFAHLYGLLGHPAFAASVRRLLATLDLTGFNPGAHAPMSDAKRRSLGAMTSGLDQAVQSFKASWPRSVAGRSDVRAFVTEDLGAQPNEAALRHALERAGFVQSTRRIRIGLLRDRAVGHGITLHDLEQCDPVHLADAIRQAREQFQR